MVSHSAVPNRITSFMEMAIGALSLIMSLSLSRLPSFFGILGGAYRNHSSYPQIRPIVVDNERIILCYKRLNFIKTYSGARCKTRIAKVADRTLN